jgi:hypothetical protein
MPSLRDSVPLLWHTQDLRPGLLSATPPGLFLFFISAYPRLVPLAAFCRRFAAGTGWFGLDAGLETSGSRAALRASVVPTFRKRRERWGTHSLMAATARWTAEDGCPHVNHVSFLLTRRRTFAATLILRAL